MLHAKYLAGNTMETVDGNAEHFNILCFSVADLCFLKDVIGVCACTSTYGCYHCLLKQEQLSAVNKKEGW